MFKRSLAQKLDGLERAVRELRASWSNGDSAKKQLEAVEYLEARVREVRAVARTNERKERRATCLHEDRARDQHGRCGKCGQTKLDPAPALVLCVCGHPRHAHSSDELERCVIFHDFRGHKCDGFKPAEDQAAAVLEKAAREGGQA